ncbi:MAG TPA: TonB-dependent receptor plug domain-containing protein [Gemmatimonadaceae bacterium]|jgi:TonB-dependent SusC/RagA subfamily outer membrane receptor|nr:TonB-dependent receptor plug domain-containing protein [Gemmatimonadaceae bacterium]
MTRTRVGLSLCVVALSISAARASAQESVTIGGHVSAAGNPVQGATVRIPALGLSSTTTSEGRYSLIVPSAKVRGQTVDLVARHVRYNIETTPVTLTGGSLIKDFELSPVGTPRADAGPTEVQPVVARVVPTRAAVDSSAYEEAAGPVDVVSGLAGRIAGVIVTTPSTMGGSAPIVVRGYRSIVNAVQPLFVVDGVPLENSIFATPGQAFGSGGFDYGTPVQGLNPADIASVAILRGADAAVLYGGRAANGVFLITTKNGHGLAGLEISAAQQFTSDGVLRLPSFQNSYGQGLEGKFAYFNGAGGGTNDGVAENWGPALQGQVIPQFSFTTPRQADVRAFLPFANNVSDFYGSGHTLKTDVAAQGANDHLNGRFSANRRDTRGLTPSSSLVRQGASLVATDQLSNELTASVEARFSGENGHNRPGTGFDVGNPAAEFARMGRQVDVSTLKDNLADFAGRQISWNYAGHNNPWFITNQNSNRDQRTAWTAGGSATYAASPRFVATLRGSRDQYDQSRNFTIDTSWFGGFAWFAGRGDFSRGGFQRQKINASETNGDVLITSTMAQAGGRTSLVLSGGAGTHTTDFKVVSDGSDQGTEDSSPTLTPTARVSASGTTTALFGAGEWIADASSLRAGVRAESYSSGNSSQIYPSLAATLDLFKLAGMKAGGITSARLHASWSKAGGEVNPLLLRTILAQSGTQPTALTLSSSLSPEVTNAMELGGEFGLLRNRASLDLTVYNERTSDVVLGIPGSASGSVVASNVAAITNKGVEATLTLVPLRNPRGIDWTVQGRYAKNSNTVDELRTGSGAVALTPSLYGVTVQARQGYALGALVGTGYRRDANTGALLLQDGLPVAEAQPRLLGVMAPSWTGSLSSTVRYWNLELSGLLDIHRGGSVFSATNLWGMSSGTFQETAFRPDTGIIIAGVDATTGKANTQHVTTEAYYHALRGIAEPWVYDAGFVKLRDLRLTFALPLRSLPVMTAQSVRVSLIGRNLALWTNVPNVDPETALSAGSLQGIEMGQLPSARSFGLQLSIAP